MKRRLTSLLTVLSALLSVSAAALWVRGYRVADRLTVQSAHYRAVGSDEEDAAAAPFRGHITIAAVQSASGVIEVNLQRSVDLTLGPENVREWGEDYPEGTHTLWDSEPLPLGDWRFGWFNIADERVWFDRFGFSYATANRGGLFGGSVDFTLTMASAPAWLFAALFGLLPDARAWRWAALRRRTARGRCPACGYDLRATPGRCPECGTSPSHD